MVGFIISALVGLVCIVMGISNMRGNISSLHSYHRHRVTENDRIPFGKKVGLGTIIIGSSIVVLSGCSIATLYTNNKLFTYIGYGVLIAGFLCGLGLAFYAMIRYNKGIF